MRRFLLVIAAVAAGLSWLLAQRIHRQQTEIAALAVHEHQLQARRERLMVQLRNAEVAIIATTANISATRNRAATRVSAAAPNPKPTFLDAIRTDPVAQNLYLAYQRSALRIDYWPVLQQLRLSPEKTAEFVENVLKRRAAEMDLQSAMLAKKLDWSDPAVQATMRQQHDAYETAQRATLGDAGFTELKKFEKDQFPRNMVDTISAEATLAGVSLEPEQRRALQAAIVGASSGNGYYHWDKVDEVARNILTPAQFELIHSGEWMGGGAGWRYQDQLNSVITRADEQDRKRG